MSETETETKTFENETKTETSSFETETIPTRPRLLQFETETETSKKGLETVSRPRPGLETSNAGYFRSHKLHAHASRDCLNVESHYDRDSLFMCGTLQPFGQCV